MVGEQAEIERLIEKLEDMGCEWSLNSNLGKASISKQPIYQGKAYYPMSDMDQMPEVSADADSVPALLNQLIEKMYEKIAGLPDANVREGQTDGR